MCVCVCVCSLVDYIILNLILASPYKSNFSTTAGPWPRTSHWKVYWLILFTLCGFCVLQFQSLVNTYMCVGVCVHVHVHAHLHVHVCMCIHVHACYTCICTCVDVYNACLLILPSFLLSHNCLSLPPPHPPSLNSGRGSSSLSLG